MAITTATRQNHYRILFLAIVIAVLHGSTARRLLGKKVMATNNSGAFLVAKILSERTELIPNEIKDVRKSTKQQPSVLDLRRARQTVLAEYSQPLAHEGPVLLRDGLLFTSNRLFDDSNQYVRVSFFNFTSGETVDLRLSDRISMANGAWGLADGRVAILSQGTPTRPAGIMAWDPVHDRVETLVTQWGAGSKFNSPNDVVQTRDGSLWFTDPQYGFDQGFRPAPESGNWVWRHDSHGKNGPGHTRLMIDGFVRPNGLAFSPDEGFLYVSDTGYYSGDGARPGIQRHPDRPRTIYRYRVRWGMDGGPFVSDRTLFAVAPSPIPDGIKVDRRGRVWTGTESGLEVFSPEGVHQGTVPVDGGVSNFVFGDDGVTTIYVLNETRLIRIDLS